MLRTHARTHAHTQCSHSMLTLNAHTQRSHVLLLEDVVVARPLAPLTLSITALAYAASLFPVLPLRSLPHSVLPIRTLPPAPCPLPGTLSSPVALCLRLWPCAPRFVSDAAVYLQSCLQPAPDIFVGSGKVASVVVVPLIYDGITFGGLYFTLDTPSSFAFMKDTLTGFVNIVVLLLAQRLQPNLSTVWEAVPQVRGSSMRVAVAKLLPKGIPMRISCISSSTTNTYRIQRFAQRIHSAASILFAMLPCRSYQHSGPCTVARNASSFCKATF
jgi:hypothetical protein